MRAFVPFAVLAAVLCAPVAAQAQSPSGQEYHQNSGAGQPGLPGNKSGPAAKSSQQNQTEQAPNAQDSARVPGMRGNKSGPAPSKE
jgi:hypothetical protein